MIEINNVYKRYRNHHGSDWVLKNINLTIPKGVSVGLIGANGAGKSTLLRLIAGMDAPDKGEIIRHTRVSWPVGLTGGMQGSMTGRQNVKFVARAQGMGSNVNDIIKFVEEFSEIGKSFDEPVKTYSSGMRSRLSFGLSLAFDFDVFISDEATAVGDRAFKKKAQSLFKNKVGSSSLIMVSHSEGILKSLCKSGVYIRSGEAIWFDDIHEAIKAYHYDIDKDKGVIFSPFKQQLKVPSADPTSYDDNEAIKVKKRIQDLQSRVSGVNNAIKIANNNGLQISKLDDLNIIVEEWKADIAELRTIYQATLHAQQKVARVKVNNINKSVNALDYLIGELQSESQDDNSEQNLELLICLKEITWLLQEIKTRDLQALDALGNRV